MNRHISSLKHPLIKHLVKLRQNHRYRYEQESVVIEGIKPISEISLHTRPKVILSCDSNLVDHAFDSVLYTTTPEVMQKVSGMIQSEGILAEFPLPMNSCLKGMKSILVLDNINEPGNLGTLLRTALALGWEGAFIVGNSCDPYNEKALRAARGACFTLPICQGTWDELYALVDENKLTPLIADINGASPESLGPLYGTLLILCNEAHGPSPEAHALGKAVSIPLSGKMESLNVAAAGAILMYLFQPRGPTHA
jgi:RNA methyltransferase, TrmH family